MTVRLAIVFVGLLLLSLALAWVYRLGGAEERARCADGLREIAEQQRKDLAAADERARQAEDRLSEVLRRVKPAAPDVREAVNADPSDCTVQPAVSERVRSAVRQSNESAR